MIDERQFNSRKSPALQHKIRKIVMNNKTGDVFGITIPRVIASQFMETHLRIYTSGTSIIMESGCKISSNDVDENKKFCFNGLRITWNEHGEVKWTK